jgi:hypothetical protein
MKLTYLIFAALTACGSSSTDNTTVDASSDHASGGDGSSQDDGSTSQDGSMADSSNVGDSGTGSGDADQLPCDPNNPATCATGHKCCSEPTHKTPPTIYECVPPQANGSCPMYP